jgi:UDP-N-acetylmuramoylalanine--D-glutamate ligase
MAGTLVAPFPVGWAGDWAAKRALVLGGGDVGFAVCDTLHELGADVTLVTDTPSGDSERILEVLGVRVVDNRGATTALAEEWSTDLVVVSMPVMRSHPLATAARDAGVPVWSEVEFSYRVADKSGVRPQFVFLAGHALGDGVAELAARMCHREGIRAIVVGTSGATALDVLRDPAGWDVLLWPLGVGELTDLHNDTDPLRTPFLGVGLDADPTLTSEALDAVFFRNEHACVYSRGGGTSEQAVEKAWVQEGCRAIGVGLDTPGMSDVGVVDDIVCDRAFLDDRRHQALELTTLGELAELGFEDQDSVGRVVAACAIARAFGVSPESIGLALRESSSASG